MDLQDGPQRDRDSYATDPAPSGAELVRTAFTDHLRQIGRLPGLVKYTAAGGGPGPAQQPQVRADADPSLHPPPPSFMNTCSPPERRFATATLALADVKSTGKLLGATINDMVLAMSSGALRALQLRYEARPITRCWRRCR